MILPPFQGPRLKVKRARKHIAEFAESVTAFGERVKLGMFPVGETETMIDYVVQFSEEPPEELPMLIGDAIHNLRAALDIMVCDIARLRGKSSDKLKFPFAADAEMLERILKKDFPRLGPDVVEAIRSQHPYIGGNLALRGLHDLDIDDKHETVLPYYLVAEGRVNLPQAFHDLMRQTVGFGLEDFTTPIHAGGRCVVPKGTNPWSIVRPLSKPRPEFPRGLPFEEAPIVEVLEGLAQVVDEVVESFAAKFGGGDLNPTIAPVADDQSVDGG